MNRHNDSSFQSIIAHKVTTLVLNKYPQVIKIVDAITVQGGRALLVGGAVRDIVLGDNQIKDCDIEVHGLTIDQLESLLRKYGNVSMRGKSFGVLRIDGFDIDWSLPRSDSAGRKPLVVVDPHLSLKKAFMRRDLTINAMGVDLKTFEFIDFFGGLYDIQHKILRVVDELFFQEDPLRFYRVMQFIGRFEMQPDEQLDNISKKMVISLVSRDRIEMEFEKLFLKSVRPSRGLRWVQSIGRLSEIMPEVAALVGVRQHAAWHPEGDVFEHAMQSLDAAALYHYDTDRKKIIILYAALLHDVGKAITTTCIDGVWRSLQHEHAGAKLVPVILKRITHNKDCIMAVRVLVKYHMVPSQLLMSNAPPSSYKRLALKVAPYASLSLLADLFLADLQGRNGASHEPLSITDERVILFRKKIEEASVALSVELPVLYGRDLLPYVKEGPEIGKLLKYAYEIQLQEGIVDKNILKKRVLDLYESDTH